MTKSIWWKAYFFVNVALTVSIIPLLLIYASDLDLSEFEWSFLFLYCLQLVALFGYVFNRKIFKPVVWQIVFLATIAYEIWHVYLMVTESSDLVSEHPKFFATLYLTTYLFLLPLWIGVFQYGYRCKTLWSPGSARKKVTVS